MRSELESVEIAAPNRKRRAQSRRSPLSRSPETIVAEEVADALAATSAERIEAMTALLDSAYGLWAARGLDRDEEFADFLESLNREGVASVVIGGIVVLVHIPYRTTCDFDVLMNRRSRTWKGRAAPSADRTSGVACITTSSMPGTSAITSCGFAFSTNACGSQHSCAP